MTVYHVATTGSDNAPGTADAPFRTINRGAEAAQPGDVVQVHEGTYREWVKPVRGGLSNRRRITFEAAPGEHVVIKGSEIITGWEREPSSSAPKAASTVWRVSVPNDLFEGANPFATTVDGDWLVPDQPNVRAHLGEVYLNGQSLYEVSSREAVSHPERGTDALDLWTGTQQPLRDPDFTNHVWYAEVGPDVTTIWANFQAANPNQELVEINVRRSVFYPEDNHLDYITVRGFELAQAATPWTPPTADQPGLIGPNWAKGWIIEDNIIHDAKCSGISLGKEASTGHNYAMLRGDKPGYQYQLESVFTARRYGWNKETIGSHIVRRNTIYNCGQNGIVGHLGCVFSLIEDNHIYNIANKHEFYGYEIAGIKLHAAIDVQILHNRIHDTTLGIWLDWQNQGTRLSRNLLYANTRDLFVEVTHGPFTVDHNVFASPVSLELFSQGGAFLNNLIFGVVRLQPVHDRATPYHVPHSTELAGYAFTYGGDDRWVGNLFLGGDPKEAFDEAKAFPGAETELPLISYGTEAYNGSPASWDEYLHFSGSPDEGDHTRFHTLRQAAYCRSNAYASGANPFDKETDAIVYDAPVRFTVVDEGPEVYLDAELPTGLTSAVVPVVTGTDLERVRLVDAEFEAPDGTPIVADLDLTGTRKNPDREYPVGPLSTLASGRTKIW